MGETCACLKLSARKFSGEWFADLLNNSDPVRVVETGKLWRDLQDLVPYNPAIHIISHISAESHGTMLMLT